MREDLTMTMPYRVRWEIEVEADSPEEAAEQAVNVITAQPASRIFKVAPAYCCDFAEAADDVNLSPGPRWRI